jgi:hypothetical protein
MPSFAEPSRYLTPFRFLSLRGNIEAGEKIAAGTAGKNLSPVDPDLEECTAAFPYAYGESVGRRSAPSKTRLQKAHRRQQTYGIIIATA